MGKGGHLPPLEMRKWVFVNTFCQDQLPVIIGFILLNTNVLMRIFLWIIWLYSTQFSLYQRRFLTLKYAKKHVCGRGSAPDPAGELTTLPQTP